MSDKSVPKITALEPELQVDEYLKQLFETDDIFRQPSVAVRLKDPKKWWDYCSSSWAISESGE